MKCPAKLARSWCGSLETMPTLDDEYQHKPGVLNHRAFKITSRKHGKAWYIDPSGPQYAIFKPCLPENMYNAHVDSVNAVVPGGTTAQTFHKYAAVPESTYAIEQEMWWKSVGATQRGISDWEISTRSTCTIARLLMKDNSAFAKHGRDLHRAVTDVMDRLLTNLNMKDAMNKVLIMNVVTPAVKERAESEIKRIRDEFERTVRRSWMG
jgi:hypothetical protein